LDREKFLAEGFDDFLSKPIIPKELEQMILKYLPKEYIIQNDDDSTQTVVEENKETDLPQLDEFDFKYALSLLGNEEILKTVLIEFHDSLDGTMKTLSELYSDINDREKLKEYRIKVHALKSTSATVGALILSKLARLLEVAAIDEDITRIHTLHQVFMDEIKKHKDKISVMVPETEKKIAGDQEMAYFDMLRASLENLDYDTSDLLSEEIKKYQYADDT